MNEVTFSIKGEIKTKQRPRASMIGGHARVYTPKDTIQYENYVRSEFQRQCGSRFFAALPLKVEMTARFRAPINLSKHKGYEYTPCMNKMDCDNIAKIVLDSLNGIAYHDDRQIVQLTISKIWSDTDEESIEVEIGEYEDCVSVNYLIVSEKAKKLRKRLADLNAKGHLTRTENDRKLQIETELSEIEMEI